METLLLLLLVFLNASLSLFMMSLHTEFVLLVLLVSFLIWRTRILQLFYLLTAMFIFMLSFLIVKYTLSTIKQNEFAGSQYVTTIADVRNVRNIFTDKAELNLFFTAHSPAGRKHGIIFETLFKIPLKSNAEALSFVHTFCPSGVYDEKRKIIFAIDQDTDQVLSVDSSKMEILKSTATYKDPDDIFMDTKRDRIVVLFEEGAAALYNPDTLELLKFRRWGCCVSSKGTLSKKHDALFVSHTFNPNIVSRVRLSDLKQIRRKILGLSSWWVSLNQGESQLYATDFFLGKIYVLNPQTLDVIKSTWIKSGVRAVIADENRKLFYVGNYLEPYLRILNSDFKVIKKVYTGHFCRSLKLLKNGRLFAATGQGLVEVHVDEILKRKN